MKYYLAYGSNLNKRQMAHRCPEAVPVGICTIDNYELVFRIVATIEPRLGQSVQCGVWEISEDDEKALDRYEGYPYMYSKRKFTVNMNGQTIEAMAYVMNRGVRPRANPHTEYLMTIEEGYNDFGLDDKPLAIAAAQI